MLLHEMEELSEIRKLSNEKPVQDALKRFILRCAEDGDTVGVAWSDAIKARIKGWLK